MKPSIPKGTRDFSPEQVAKRNYIFHIIREVFELFGLQPIETPSMENRETLMGKYGEEGDKLIFNVLNSGDYLKELRSTNEEVQNLDSTKSIHLISEKALRYDLTIPFARYVVMHQHEINFPFKRYQIQPVWRADRPQKGRYREFYQCDGDIVGSYSLLNEVDFVQIFDQVFNKLGIRAIIKINNRKVLAGLAEACNEKDNLTNITAAIDKLDKIGMDKVKIELKERGLSSKSIDIIEQYLSISGDAEQKIVAIEKLITHSETSKKGITELRTLFSYLKNNITIENSTIQFDGTLARGLNYYTGTIFEVKAQDVSIGSIAGGGRYDDLTGLFGLPNIPGVGISFGADRIYDVLEELNIFPPSLTGNSTRVLFANFDLKSEKYLLPVIQKVRQKGISAELYPDQDKLKKQFKYADNKKIPFVVVVGPEEIKSEKFSLKNMQTGDQEEISLEQMLAKFIDYKNKS